MAEDVDIPGAVAQYGAPAEHYQHKLDAGSVGLSGVLMQSIAQISPTLGLFYTIAFNTSQAGIAAPLTYLVAFGLCLALAVTIGGLARNLPSAGGFYTYVPDARGAAAQRRPRRREGAHPGGIPLRPEGYLGPMSTPRRVVVGVDLGGTATRVAVVDPDRPGATVHRAVPTRSLVAQTSGRSVALLAETLRSLLDADTELLAVGVGASGPLDSGRGIIDNPDTLPWFSGLGIVHELRAAFGVPVWLENDAVCAALGEYHLGAGAGSLRMLMVTLGTGIGAAVIENGQPYRAADGGHPEAGHIGIGASTEICYCGATGCWELVASRTALERAAVSLVPPTTLPAERLAWLGTHAAIEPEVQQCLARYGASMARGLLVLRTVYRPDRIVLGGSVAALYPRFRDDMDRAMRLTGAFNAVVPVVVGTLGDIAGALGAAQLGADAMSRRPSALERNGAPLHPR